MMTVLEPNLTSSLASTTPAWIQHYHQALQAAILTDKDQCIGHALDALGIAYGILHQHNRTLHYCAIAADILQTAGDLEGAAIALQHSQRAAQTLQQSR